MSIAVACRHTACKNATYRADALPKPFMLQVVDLCETHSRFPFHLVTDSTVLEIQI